MKTENLGFNTMNDIKPRPGAGNGIWVLFLLPISIIVSVIRHPIILTPTYKLISLYCLGLVITSFIISYKTLKNQTLHIWNIGNLTGTLLTACAIHLYLQKDWLFSIFTSIIVTFLYLFFFLFILRKFKECFSLGEAGIACQALTILLNSLVVNVIDFFKHDKHFSNSMQISTIIIQIGLLGIGIIAGILNLFNIQKTASFYIVSILTIFLIILLPLHVLLRRSPLLWICEFIFQDISTIKLTFFWGFCCIITALAVNKQIKFAQKASTGGRKIFHILALLIFFPGLLYRCSLLYLASGVVVGIFFTLEIVRIFQVYPLGQHLQDGFVVFCDEKDSGNFALTPIYLLVSFSLPLWLHPAPCDITDSAIFGIIPLLSGLLIIGVGDTAASVIGSHYGKTCWPASKKTIEGTLACILSQVGVIHCLIYFGCIHNISKGYLLRVYFSIFITSLVEAKTTQVDNLVLPFIMYILLI